MFIVGLAAGPIMCLVVWYGYTMITVLTARWSSPDLAASPHHQPEQAEKKQDEAVKAVKKKAPLQLRGVKLAKAGSKQKFDPYPKTKKYGSDGPNGMSDHRLQCLREGARMHAAVRQHAQNLIKPGMYMTEICDIVERKSKELVRFEPQNPLKASWGFPTGCSINNVAAHWTPNPGDKTILKASDLVKLDFGVQLEGNIIDCAFSFSFDPMHDELMAAVKDATNSAIRKAGVDVRLRDIGKVVAEVMSSYEVDYGKGPLPVQAVANLCGHSMMPYAIHAGKSVPQIDNMDHTKMKEGEVFAIETFGTSGGGSGLCWPGADCSHYMRRQKDSWFPIKRFLTKRAEQLLRHIDRRYSTLAFCRRWLDQEGHDDYPALTELVSAGLVDAYPPLLCASGSYTAQYEHTIVVHAKRTEVLSRAGDF